MVSELELILVFHEVTESEHLMAATINRSSGKLGGLEEIERKWCIEKD